MREFNSDLFDLMYQHAKESPRKRSHHNLHGSFDEKVQRLFIALLKGSYVEPHFHSQEHQWENFFVLEGEIKVCLYNSDGTVRKTVFVGDGNKTRAIEFFPNDIHSVECISDKAIMLEVKEGPFNPEFAKVMMNFD